MKPCNSDIQKQLVLRLKRNRHINPKQISDFIGQNASNPLYVQITMKPFSLGYVVDLTAEGS